MTTGREGVIDRLGEGAEESAALIARAADAPSANPGSIDGEPQPWLRLWRGLRERLAGPEADRPDGAERLSLAQRLRRALTGALTDQTDRWPLWTPVAFGGGCAAYLALRHEPSAWALYALAGVLVVLAVAARRTGWRLFAVAATLAACFAGGMAIADLRSARVAGPVAPAGLGAVMVEGWVVDVAGPGAHGARVLLAPVTIEGLRPEATPTRLRVTLRGDPPAPGTPLKVRALVNPPPAPASPGAYDFARDAWFESIGGVAFALGQARDAYEPAPPARLSWTMRINAGRWALAQRIVDRLGARIGGVVAAMTTGHEAWIQPEDMQSMRDSGLAHLLSISGLHMAIVGGFAFYLARLLVAAWPWLALRAPGKKIAAVVGLVAVGGYLVLSGAPAAAERSAVTAAVAFAAILLDRRAISLNALAVAAFVVLLTRPESVAQPGFQMSFAATAALVALAEIWPRRLREISAPWPILAFQRLRSWLFAGFGASLVAGLATGPFAIQHFNRTATYGLLSNLLESPISTFVTMPFLALGAVLEPFGLGGPFLTVAGWGVRATLAIAAFVAGLPGAVRVVPSAPEPALAVSFLGVLFACLWRGRGRWLAIPFAAAVLIWPRPEPPRVWIAADGGALAIREGRTAVALRPDTKTFATDLWTRRRGLEPAEAGLLATRYACNRSACAPSARVGGLKVAAWWGRRPPDAERLSSLCAGADLVSVRAVVDRLPSSCAHVLVLDGADFARAGAYELWRSPGGRWTAVTNRDARGERPWTRGGVPDVVSDSGG